MNKLTHAAVEQTLPSKKFMLLFNELAVEKLATHKVFFSDFEPKSAKYASQLRNYDDVYVLEKKLKFVHTTTSSATTSINAMKFLQDYRN